MRKIFYDIYSMSSIWWSKVSWLKNYFFPLRLLTALKLAFQIQCVCMVFLLFIVLLKKSEERSFLWGVVIPFCLSFSNVFRNLIFLIEHFKFAIGDFFPHALWSGEKVWGKFAPINFDGVGLRPECSGLLKFFVAVPHTKEISFDIRKIPAILHEIGWAIGFSHENKNIIHLAFQGY